MPAKKAPNPKVHFQDKDLIIFVKPSGWMTYGEDPGVQESYEEKHGIKLFPVHRLDKDTEGLLAFAKNPRAAGSLSKAFQRRRVEKTYLALVLGRPASLTGSIKLPLKKKSSDPEEPARTDYKVLGFVQQGAVSMTLVELQPFTGKFHQIRKHMRSIDCPILGDPLYCPEVRKKEIKVAFGEMTLCLCASKLAFAHPITRKPLQFEVKPSFLARLKNLHRP